MAKHLLELIQRDWLVFLQAGSVLFNIVIAYDMINQRQKLAKEIVAIKKPDDHYIHVDITEGYSEERELVTFETNHPNEVDAIPVFMSCIRAIKDREKIIKDVKDILDEPPFQV